MICFNCGQTNDYQNVYCSRCGIYMAQSLSPVTASGLQQRKRDKKAIASFVLSLSAILLLFLAVLGFYLFFRQLLQPAGFDFVNGLLDIIIAFFIVALLLMGCFGIAFVALVLALIFGILGLQSKKSKYAILGIVLSSLSLLVFLILSARTFI